MHEGMIDLKKNIHRYIALISAILLIFCGCSGKNKGDTGNKGPETTITLQMRQSDSFNPLSVTHHSVRDALSLCYEPLFVIGDSIVPEGVLATGVEVSADCLSAVVILKDSALWHDGVSVTSADVVHTINLLQENPSLAYSECVRYIESATAIDAYSLRLKLSRPYGQISYSLTFPIVAAHNKNPDEKIIGTGPYKYSGYVPATTLELVKNDKWHGGEASFTNANVAIIRDDMAATTAFNTGLISAVTGGSYDMENATPKSNSRSTMYPSSEYEYMALNHKNEFFSSQTVRSAVSSAIDRSAVVKECYMGAALEANAPIHPGAMDMAESTVLSQYSLSNAAELLFLEGYSIPEGEQLLKNSEGKKFSFELLVNEENQNRIKTAELIAQQLFLAGIEVNVKALPFDDYAQRISIGKFDAYIGGTRLNNLYDYEFLLASDGELNNYNYDGKDISLALEGLSLASNADAMNNAVFNFEEVFLREQPVCGLVFKMNTLLTAENIIGKLLPNMNSPYRNINGWSLKS